MSLGAIAMSLSTLIVAANALLLRRLRFAHSESAAVAGR
jgi:cation transport ATPase